MHNHFLRPKSSFISLRFFYVFFLGCSPQIAPSNTTPISRNADVDAARIEGADRDSANWLTYGRTYSEQRFSPLKAINDSNVSQLGLVWHFDLDTHRGQEATPIVVDGMMYFTSAWSKVFALNAATGAPLWAYDPKVPPEWGVNACCDVVNRGVAVWHGKVIFAHARWASHRARRSHGQESLGNSDDRSQISLHDHRRASRGKRQSDHRKWRRGDERSRIRLRLRRRDRQSYLALLHRSRRSLEAIRKSDPRESSEDVDRRMVEISAAAEPSGIRSYTIPNSIFSISAWAMAPRGTGRFAVPKAATICSFLRLSRVKPDTGEYVWHYQETPAEMWDYTASQQITLADVTIDGQPRKVLFHAPKNGFFYVLDRASGALISAKPYTYINWATGVNMKTGRPDRNSHRALSRQGSCAGCSRPARRA